MQHNYEFLKDLNDIQKSICVSNDNFILTACPGSGKTRTITYRIAYLAVKYNESKKLNIAITYTNRAADEIENRLLNMSISTHNVWTGTIHQFCMKFIIRPYSMYHEKLSKGYTIIDEYVKEKYIKVIAEELGNKSYVKELYKNSDVMGKYYAKIEQNKEIDFELILQYSQELIEENSFIAQNVASIIRSIHVDEYQDTNERQYKILASIINVHKDINLLFVGDVNQAIYRNLGGVAKSAKEIRNLFHINFTEKCLDGCYRSTQRIVDYYVNYEVAPTGVFSVSETRDADGIIKFDSTVHKDELSVRIAEIVREELGKDIPEEEICIVAPQWYQIYPMANKLRKILPHSNFDAPDITPIKYDPLNIFCLIAKLLFTQKGGHALLRRKVADEILIILKEDYGFIISEKVSKLEILKAINATQFTIDDGVLTLKNAISNVIGILQIKKNGNIEKIYNQFFEKIDSRLTEYKLPYDCEAMVRSFKEKNGIVINTIHGIKGEEYKTVIGFDLLNGHLPHWDYIMKPELKELKQEETNKMLYVLCSRSKENLYLFSETGRTTNKGTAYRTTDELAICMFDYD
jgi:superfamily I DNA/RNA helicase